MSNLIQNSGLHQLDITLYTGDRQIPSNLSVLEIVFRPVGRLHLRCWWLRNWLDHVGWEESSRESDMLWGIASSKMIPRCLRISAMYLLVGGHSGIAINRTLTYLDKGNNRGDMKGYNKYHATRVRVISKIISDITLRDQVVYRTDMWYYSAWSGDNPMWYNILPFFQCNIPVIISINVRTLTNVCITYSQYTDQSGSFVCRYIYWWARKKYILIVHVCVATITKWEHHRTFVGSHSGSRRWSSIAISHLHIWRTAFRPCGRTFSLPTVHAHVTGAYIVLLHLDLATMYDTEF